MASPKDRIADMTPDELRALVIDAVREALEPFKQKDRIANADWEAATDAIMERFDDAWRRLADL